MILQIPLSPPHVSREEGRGGGERGRKRRGRGWRSKNGIHIGEDESAYSKALTSRKEEGGGRWKEGGGRREERGGGANLAST